jgi:anionic cell wall polymer biosynthesis LytR-Cps2A-Psr (LCP) family protein
LKNLNPLKILLFVFLFIIGFSVGYVATKGISNLSQKDSSLPKVNDTASKSSDEVPNPNIQVSGTENAPGTITPISANMVNILFLGMGGAGHDGGGLTDSITLASIDYVKKSINLIALPRDLWYGNQKINAAYATGANSLKFAVGQITGLNVNYFIAIDFGHFVSGVETLGGIDIENPKTWNDNFYPVVGKEQELCGFTPEYNAEINQKYKGFELEKLFICRYEQLHFEKGSIHLDGATALKYMRSRHSAEYGSDFARGERAQTVLIAIGKKLIENKLTNPNDATFKKLAGVVTSDIALTKVPEILKTLGDVGSYPVVHTYLTDQNVLTAATGPAGAYILVPKAGSGNFEAVRTFIQNSK